MRYEVPRITLLQLMRGVTLQVLPLDNSALSLMMLPLTETFLELLL